MYVDPWDVIERASAQLAAGQASAARVTLEGGLNHKPGSGAPPAFGNGFGWRLRDQSGPHAWAEDTQRFRDGQPSEERFAVFRWNGEWWGRTLDEDHLKEAEALNLYTARVGRAAH